MSDTDQTNYPRWTDDQWSRINRVITGEAQKARVAAEFLPLYGPVDTSVVAVPNLLLGVAPVAPAPGAVVANRLEVDSAPDLFLATLSVQVPLASYEVADPELLAATVAFRRAAVTLARIEDALIFNGQPGRSLPPVPTFPGGWLAPLPAVYRVSGGGQWPGLVPAGARPNNFPPPANVLPRASRPISPVPVPPANTAAMQTWSDIIVRAVGAAIGDLEANGHSGPFACFLSQNVFEAAHTPASGLVLPRDRILPFLGGDYLRRTNTVPDGYGVIVALGGQPVEIVVATDMSVRYLQQTAEPRFLFRVAERIALRVKEWNAVAVLHPVENHEPGSSHQQCAESLPMSADNRPVPPSIDNIKGQIQGAIDSLENKIDARNKTIATHQTDKAKKVEQLAANMKMHGANVEKLTDDHANYVAAHRAKVDQLKNEVTKLEADKATIEARLKDLAGGDE